MRKLDGEGDDLLCELGDERAGRVGEGVQVDLVGKLEEFCASLQIGRAHV